MSGLSSSGFRRSPTTGQTKVVSNCQCQLYIFRGQITIFWIDYWRVSGVVETPRPPSRISWRLLWFFVSTMETTSWRTRIDPPIVCSSCSTSPLRSPSVRWFTTVTMNNFASPFLYKVVLSRCVEHVVWHRFVWKTCAAQQAQFAISSALRPYFLKRYPWGFR